MALMLEPIHWRRAAGEILLIVTGILIALAIDAYVNDLAEHEEERYYLSELTTELSQEAHRLEKQAEVVERVIEHATGLLATLQSDAASTANPVSNLLVGAVIAENTSHPAAVWTELISSGDLKLIRDREQRSSLVTHHISRKSLLEMVESNFIPAIRDLRATAWDVMPVSAFRNYFEEGDTGVPHRVTLEKLRARPDTRYLLKRVIVTGTVASRNLRLLATDSRALAEQLGAATR